MGQRASRPFDLRQLAGWRAISVELARRAAVRDGAPQCGSETAPYVIRVSDPITPIERLQLIAARLQGTPIAIMPHPCKTADEWMGRYRARLS
jgi:hypothetical protein